MLHVSSTRRTSLIFLTAGSLVAALAVAATGTATAAGRCQVGVTSLVLDSKQHFAGGSLLKRYSAAVDYPLGTTYDQSGKVILGVLPSTAYPTLLRPKIGMRAKVGAMVKAQQPTAVAAINGDFFATPTIDGQTFEIARGPMVDGGRIIRANRTRIRVVGVDNNHVPFGGEFGVRGAIQFGTELPINVQGINWQSVQGGGVTVYTPDWSVTAATPRPAGVAEWVINRHNKIKQIRTSTRNADRLGYPVADGTRVLAFSTNFAAASSKVVVGQKVQVNIRQSTDTGVRLETIIGRGLQVITDGVAAPLGCDAYTSKAARPRTMVGWTKSGAWRTFTVPGKQFPGPGERTGGFGLAMEATIAKKLGLYQAFELDGGGSTTLYTRSSGGNWSRRDLYGVAASPYTFEREVVNGLAFMVPAPAPVP